MFVPDDPYRITLSVIIFMLAGGCFAVGGRSERFIAAALIVSWIGARTATVTEHPLVFVAGLCLAAFLAFLGRSGVARAICWIYGARILLSSLLLFGILNWRWLWFLNNEVFLTAQLLIVSGALIDPYVNGKISEKVRLYLPKFGN